MAGKVIGIILLIAGVVFLLFGFSYINSPQYKVMSMVNGVTGGSDPTGNVAIGIGAVAAVIGLLLLIVGGSSKKVSSPATENPHPIIPEVDVPTVDSTSPELVIEEPKASIPDESPQTSSGTAISPINNISPHLIYAGAGLIAVLGIFGMILLFTRKANDNSVASAPINNAANTQSNRTISAPPPTTPSRHAMTLPADEMWVDAGVSVNQGDQLTISATGQWSNSGNEKFVNADGYNSGWPGIILESGHIAQLIGKIGNNIFSIGQRYSGRSPASGRLYLSMNDVPSHFDDNFGALQVSITTGNAAPSAQSNIPTVKQMQDDIEKEVKKMEDEANR